MKKIQLSIPKKAEHAGTMPRGAFVIMEQLLCVLASFVVSQAEILNGMSPFGMAFVAGVPTNLLIGTTLGSIAGYALFTGGGYLPLRYIATVICIAAVRYCLRDVKNIRTNAIVSCSLAFSAALVTGFAIGFSEGITLMSAVMYVSEAVLAAGGAFFFNRGLSINKRGLKNFRVNEGQFACFIVAWCIILMSFSTLNFFQISPARIVAVIAILFAARIGKQAAGSIAGVAMGASMALVPQMNFLAASYSVGGLIAGIFAPMGQLGVAIAFATTNAIVTLYLQNGDFSVQTLIEVGVATIIFVLIPPKYVKRAEEFFRGDENGEDTSAVRRAISARLSLASKAITDVSECVDKVSKGLLKVQAPNIAQVYTTVQDKICCACPKREFCWQTNFNDSMNVFSDLGSKLKNSKEISRSDLPDFFAERCDKSGLIVSTLAAEYNKQVARLMANRDCVQVRGVVSEQFESVSNLLDDISQEFNEIESIDEKTAFCVEETLRANEIIPISVNCILDKYDRMKLEVHCPKIMPDFNITELTREIGTACKRNFMAPNVTNVGNDSFMVFSEVASYTLQIGHAQLISNASLNCGDSYDFFDDGRGRQIFVVSDGMGTGNRASVDGNMAQSLIAKLVKAGFSFECALRVVNSALFVKSSEESFATLDIMCFDLFTGKADFLKAGAPSSFVRHKNKVKEIEMASLPAGILKDIHFEKNNCSLTKGDIILLATDGVMGNDPRWLKTELAMWDGDNAQELAQTIASKAYNRCKDEKTDDITVVIGIVN